ncbi:lipoprotein PslD, partial [Pseudomonas syringae pv. actinidiae ICMP 19096]
MKSMMLIASLLLLSACNTPSRVGLPDDRAQIEAGQAAGRAL